jgi:hypothetical protein
MTDRDELARANIIARLAVSREELRQVLDPPRRDSEDSEAGEHHDGFPRSRTMQMLMGNRGLGLLGAIAGGLFIARPSLALRLLRLLPVSAIGRVFLMKALGAMRAKHVNPE